MRLLMLNVCMLYSCLLVSMDNKEQFHNYNIQILLKNIRYKLEELNQNPGNKPILYIETEESTPYLQCPDLKEYIISLVETSQKITHHTFVLIEFHEKEIEALKRSLQQFQNENLITIAGQIPKHVNKLETSIITRFALTNPQELIKQASTKP